MRRVRCLAAERQGWDLLRETVRDLAGLRQAPDLGLRHQVLGVPLALDLVRRRVQDSGLRRGLLRRRLRLRLRSSRSDRLRISRIIADLFLGDGAKFADASVRTNDIRK